MDKTFEKTIETTKCEKQKTFGVGVIRTNISSREFIKSMCSEKDETDEAPFYAVNLGETSRRLETMKNELPDVMPHYAVKCNNDQALLEFLAKRGISFDCASKKEIETIIYLGVSSDRIILANPFKQIADLKFATEHGVALMTFDSVEELRKIKRFAPNAKVLVRLREPHDIKAEIQASFGEKFGSKLEDVENLLKACKDLDLQIVGTCFHVGSGCKESSMWRVAIKQARQVFQMADNLGIRLSILDIGGGIPGGENDTEDVKQIFGAIRESLEEYFPPASGIRVISEPGTYLVKSAVTLVTRVIARKTSRDIPTNQILADISNIYRQDLCHVDLSKTHQDVKMYVTSAGVFNSLMGHKVYGEEHQAIVLGDTAGTQLQPSILWGPSCDTYDRVTDGFAMLPTLDIGDWIYFKDVGNYVEVCASDFNGNGMPYKIHYAT